MIRGKYTVVLKTMMDDPKCREALERAMSTYPLYKKTSKEEFIPSIIPTREELNNKILNHYKYREIGFETIGRFLDELKIALEEIMPYYNQLFFSTDQDYNVKYNVDYLRETKRNRKDTSENTRNEIEENMMNSTESTSSESSSEGSNSSEANDSSSTTANVEHNNKSVNSKTPQGIINIGTKDIDSVNYADNLSFSHDINTDTGTTTGTSTTSSSSDLTGTSSSEKENNQTTNITNNVTSNELNNEDEEIQEKIIGNYGMTSTQSLIRQYRELIINVEKQIIEDVRISDLFMKVW